jgi:hypothetical protein
MTPVPEYVQPGHKPFQKNVCSYLEFPLIATELESWTRDLKEVIVSSEVVEDDYF